MRLQRYILLRLLYLLPVALAVIVVNFLLIHLAPGDVATTLAGDDANPEYIAHIRSLYGLDRPFYEQLITYLGRVPLPGEEFEIDGLHVQVLDADRKRIHRVRITLPVDSLEGKV